MWPYLIVPVGDGIGLIKSELDAVFAVSGMLTFSGESKCCAALAKRPLVELPVSSELFITLELKLLSSSWLKSALWSAALSSIKD